MSAGVASHKGGTPSQGLRVKDLERRLRMVIRENSSRENRLMRVKQMLSDALWENKALRLKVRELEESVEFLRFGTRPNNPPGG